VAAGERLSPMDATLLYLETATSSSSIGVVFRFDGPIAFDDYVKDFRNRRIQRIPRFRQVVAPVPLNLSFPTWEVDPGFDLDIHLHDIRLDPPGSDRELRSLTDRVIAQRFDFRRSPWDIFVVNGLHDGSSALIFHMHHCITDGVGFFKILQAVFDASPQPFCVDGPDESPSVAPPLPGAMERLRGAMRDRFARRAKRNTRDETASEAADRKARKKEKSKAFFIAMSEFMQAPGIRLPFNAPLSGRVHHGTVSFDLAELQQVAKALGGTINDVLLTILGGAIDRLSQELEIEVAGRNCRVYQAANARTADDHEKWGNRLAFMPAIVPLGLSDSLERLRRIADYTRKVKDSGVREAADNMVQGFQTKLPPPLAKLGLRLMLSRAMERLTALSKSPPLFNIYVTNVRMPEFNSHLGGRRIIGLTGLAPLVPNTGVTCASANYDGRLHVGITADAVTMPDVEGFVAKLTRACEDLLEAARAASLLTERAP